MVTIIKKWSVIFIIFCVLIFEVCNVCASNGEELNLYAQYAVLMDGESGRVLYGKNVNEQVPMASTTKIMTCIIALEYGNLDDVVVISEYASKMPKVKLYAKKGDSYYLKDLLYSLMLESHNDSAVAIAEHIGGSVEEFVDLMNQKARDIGCFNTFFITPNGLDATADVVMQNGKKETRVHSTTPTDLGKIMRYCIKESSMKEQFLEITRASNYGFANVVEIEEGRYTYGSKSKSCTNHNAFLSMMEGALTGKTGFTGKAGYCYVGALERDGKTFIVVLLACGWPNNKGYKWSDTKKLMNYGINNYSLRRFDELQVDNNKLSPIEVNYGIPPQMGDKAFAMLKIKEEELDKQNYDSAIQGVLMNNQEIMKLNYEIKDNLTAPIYEGEVVGEIQYLVEGKVWKTKSIVVEETVNKINFNWCLRQIVELYMI